jgi:hypothetical protein
VGCSKFRLIYCFFLVKSWGFFIEKVHILRITHFSETTKDRNLIFGMGGDANVKLCIQHLRQLICLVTLIINIYGSWVGISTIKKFTSGRGWGMTPGA